MTPASGRPVCTRHAVAVALTLTALLMVVAGVAHAATSVGWGSVYLDEPVAGVVLAVVGGVLATWVPANPIGWLFVAGPPVQPQAVRRVAGRRELPRSGARSGRPGDRDGRTRCRRTTDGAALCGRHLARHHRD
jgi:hypothetical protein